MSATMPWTPILVTDLGGLALGASILWGPWRAKEASWGSDLLRLGGLGVALAVFAVGAAYAASPAGAGLAASAYFLVLRLACHALFCVLVPLAIARGAVRRGAIGVALVVLGLLAEGAYVWARRVEPYRLEVTRHALASARLDGRTAPLRVAVLADLQSDDLGAFEERVFEELDDLRADLLLIPGDLLALGAVVAELQGVAVPTERERAKLAALFAGLRHRPRLGFLMVGGDCEPRGVHFDEAGVRILEDEIAVFPDERIQVIGLTRIASRRAIEERFAAAARAFDGLTIVMGHAPEFALSAPAIGVPVLCVAGHTHGGQVQLPFLGPPITLARVPRRLAAGGLFALGDSWLCQSRGIGMERGYAPRIRFLCRPELVALELAPTGLVSAGTIDALRW